METLTRIPGASVSVRNLQNEMNRVFDELIPFGWRDSEGVEGGEWAPIFDLYENDNEYQFTVDLPGVTKSDIHINAQENILVITGKRESKHKPEDPGYLRRRRPTGTFKRSFALPTKIDTDNIKAQFKDGVLTIEAPKAEESKSVSIS